VFDKSLSYGYEGPICADLRAALHGRATSPAVHGYIGGLGGRDIKARELVAATCESIEWMKKNTGRKGTGWVNLQL